MTCGKLLWQRRVSARLSRARLARLAGLCEATIKLIEKDRTRPRKETLLRLLAVTELMLFHRIHRRRNRRRITQKE